MTDLSPITGLTRDHWAATADNLLLSLRSWASPDNARIELPGRPSRYGPDSDTLEAFARTFLLAAIRLKGDGGKDPHGFANWYAVGLRAGTTPGSPTAWPRPNVLGQAKVEACSIALGLHLSRPWLWDRLDAADQANIVDWLSTVIGEEYPPINWVWFQIVVETFLRSVGASWSQDDIDSGLAVHESLYRSGGWYADGPERSYDHYNGWALHVYPLLWADMAPDLCAPELRRLGQTASAVPGRRRAAGRLRRLTPATGPQPHLPLRRRGSLLGRRDDRSDQPEPWPDPPGLIRNAAPLHRPRRPQPTRVAHLGWYTSGRPWRSRTPARVRRTGR